MPDLDLPLWFVSSKRPPAVAGGRVRAFTRTVRAIEYLRRQPAGELKIHLVSDRESLLAIVADLHDADQYHVLFDADADGSGGRSVPINDLVALATRLSPTLTDGL
jgi:hypothetical protein